MDFRARALNLVTQTEKGLARLAAEAAEGRDYGGAGSLLALAQRIAEAARDLGFASAAAGSLSLIAPSLTSAPSSSGPPTDKKSHGGYPRFKRDGDTLVKIGYSKSDRSTYEHRTPKDVLDRLIQKMRRHGGGGEQFTMEQLTPLHDSRGSELPSYQAYLCLAWLVTAKLLTKHGRQGYTFTAGIDLASAVESSWQSLPRR